MIFFKVTDGEEISGYWLSKEKAQKKADELNDFVENHNKDPKVISNQQLLKPDKYYVEPIETED